MTNQSLAPIPPAQLNVRQQQVMKVLQLMAEGVGQEEACALAHINQRTYQRWVSKPEMTKAIQQISADSLNAAAIQAANALPAAVSYQIQVAKGLVGDPRDANKAAVFLRDLADSIGARIPGARKAVPSTNQVPLDDGEETSFTVTFKPHFASQKVKVESEVKDQGQVIDGEFTDASV